VTEHRNRSVVDGVWRQASVSQLKTLSACPLAWWWDKVQQVPRAPKKGQIVGIEGHRQIEHTLTEGQDVLSPMARVGLPYLPPARAEEVWIERRFDGTHRRTAFIPENTPLHVGTVPMDGYVDVVDWRWVGAGGEAWPGGPEVEPGTVVVIDHKFSKDPGRYAPQPEALNDPTTEHGLQMVGYATALANRFADSASRVLSVHLYYKTVGKPACVPVVAPSLALDAARDLWQTVTPRLHEIGVRTARETDPLNVDHNPSHCGNYGGCDYAQRCPRSPINRLVWRDESDPMTDPLAGLFPVEAPTQPAPPPPPPPPPAAPAPTQPPAQALPPGWCQARAAQVGKNYFAPATGKVGLCTAVYPAGTAQLRDAEGKLTVVGPDDLLFEVAQPPQQPRPAEGTASFPAGTFEARPTASVLPPDAPQSNPLTSSAPLPPLEVPKPRKERKAKAAEQPQLAPPPQPEPSVFVPPTASAPTAQAQPSMPQPSTEPLAGVTLYIGCRPDAGAVRLDDYVSGLVADLCTKTGAKDLRLTPRTASGESDRNHPLAFDRWRSILAMAVAARPPPPGAYFVHGGSEYATIVAIELARLLPPERVVRGS